MRSRVVAFGAMRRTIALLCLASSLAVPALAQTERKSRVSEFKAKEMTDEERAEAMKRGRSRMTRWQEAELPPEPSFPWMPLGFTLLAFGIAAPFALGAYRRSAQELDEVAAATAPPPKKPRAPKSKAPEPAE